MLNFTNKRVVVTGGSGSIGCAVIEKFIEAGAEVIAFDRDEQALEQLRTQFSNSKFIAVQGDVLNRDNLTTLVEIAGSIDVLVCLIGLFIPVPFEQADDELLQAMFDVNVKSTMLTIQSALPAMKEGSAILTFSSSAVDKPLAQGGALYAANKAAIRGLSRGLAKEFLGRKIRVNTLSPGPVDTVNMASPMTVDESMKEQIIETVPMKRLATVSEVADATLYLCSDQASFITGEELKLDGGITNL